MKEVFPSLKSQITMPHLFDFLNFFFDYVTQHMFLPGKIENWVVLMDMNKMSATDMPYKVPFSHYLSDVKRDKRTSSVKFQEPNVCALPYQRPFPYLHPMEDLQGISRGVNSEED